MVTIWEVLLVSSLKHLFAENIQELNIFVSSFLLAFQPSFGIEPESYSPVQTHLICLYQVPASGTHLKSYNLIPLLVFVRRSRMGQKGGKRGIPRCCWIPCLCWQRLGQGSVQAQLPWAFRGCHGAVLALPVLFSVSRQLPAPLCSPSASHLPLNGLTNSSVKLEVSSYSTYTCVLFHFLAAVVLSALWRCWFLQ